MSDAAAGSSSEAGRPEAGRPETAPPSPSPAAPAPAAAPAPYEGLPVPRRYYAAATVVVGISLAVLDSTIANVALPTIAADLNTTSAASVWVINAYNLTLVMMILPVSALAERVGFRRVFGTGLILFTIASLACALSTSLAMLTASRVLQGMGASCVMSLIGGMMRNIYPLNKLGRGMSWNSMTVGIMSVVGPTVGSAILAVASWPWIFAVNVPFGVAAIFGLRHLPDAPINETPFDWISALLCMVMLGLFVSSIDMLGSDVMQAFGLFVVSVAAGVLMWRRVRGQTAPVVPIDLLRIRTIGFAAAASFCTFIAQMSAYVALPFYFQEILHRGHLEVGMLMGAWPIGTIAVAPFVGRLSDRYSAALLAGIGAAAMSVGLLWIALLPLTASNPAIMIGMFLTGLGFGFFQVPNNRSMLSNAPRSRSGSAGGLQATMRVFGQSCGTALVALSFGISSTHGATMALVMGSISAALAIGVNFVRFHKLAPSIPR